MLRLAAEISDRTTCDICQRSSVLYRSMACVCVSLLLLTNNDNEEALIRDSETPTTAPKDDHPQRTHHFTASTYKSLLPDNSIPHSSNSRELAAMATFSIPDQMVEPQKNLTPSIAGSIEMITSSDQFHLAQRPMASDVLSHSLSPNDPDNPTNWSLYRKMYVSSCGFLFAASG